MNDEVDSIGHALEMVNRLHLALQHDNTMIRDDMLRGIIRDIDKLKVIPETKINLNDIP